MGTSAESILAIGLLVLPLGILLWLVASWVRHPFSTERRGVPAAVQLVASIARQIVSARRNVTQTRTSVVAQIGVIAHASVEALGYLVTHFVGLDGAPLTPLAAPRETDVHGVALGAAYELSVRFQTQAPGSYHGAAVRPSKHHAPLELSIRVEGTGLRVSDGGNSTMLVAPQSTASHTFRVEPTSDGPTRMRVDLYHQNAWVQTIDFALSVSPPPSPSPAIPSAPGESVRVEASNTLQVPGVPAEARHLHLSLAYAPGEGRTYAVRANDGREPLSWRTIRTPCREKDIEEINAGLRGALNELRVYYENYLSSADDQGTAGVYNQALERLARRGNDAFNRLFPDADDREYVISAIHQVPRANVEISSDAVFIPWDLLYLKYDPAGVEVTRFLGFAANISLRLTDVRQSVSRTDHAGSLPRVSLVANQQLPEVVEHEVPYFRTLSGAGKIVLNEWLDTGSPDSGTRGAGPSLARFFDFCQTGKRDVVHFACHAVAETYGPDSYLDISSDLRVTIEEMGIRQYVWGGSPVAILNACGTGVRDPSKTSDFVRRFLLSGCRGVVATECDIPDLFASAFVQEFFDRLLAGAPIALALFETRLHFWTQHRNPLGLLYSAYLPFEERLL